MVIMSQNKQVLINSEYVREIFIAPAGDTSRVDTEAGKVRLVAATDENVIIGMFKEVKHAVGALEFIAVCMVDEEAREKITHVPTQENMELSERMSSDDVFPGEVLKEFFEKIGMVDFI